jgi:hypothetical protein
MESRTFPDDPISKQSWDVGQGFAPPQPDVAAKKARAVEELLRNKSLTDTLGEHGEYQVRTTITTRQTWRYQCRVFRHGKEIRRGFSPLDVDRTREMRKEPKITEEMRVGFADEAVEGHFALCAAVREYLLLASIYPRPPRNYRFQSIALVALFAASLLTVYWVWKDQYHANLRSLQAKSPPQTVRWKQGQVFFQHPAGQPFAFLLPGLERTPVAAPVEITMEPSSYRPSWMEFDPKELLLSGVAPAIANDQAYHLVFEAKAKDGNVSRLDVYMSIIGETKPPLPPSPTNSMPAPTDRSPATDCLLKILKGEPC